MRFRSALSALALASLSIPAVTRAQTITFEELGPQPSGFLATNPLRVNYAGLSFSGPGALDGGAILNVGANFGIAPRSGDHFFAFNEGVGNPPMLNGGQPFGPEDITFASLVDMVQIYASSGDTGGSFRIDAFADGGALIGSSVATAVAGQWEPLSVSAASIRRVRLTQTSGDGTYVFDDLSYHPVPSPSTLIPLVAAATVASRRRRTPQGRDLSRPT